MRTAVAAGRKNHLWDVVHGLYLSQGAENAGWVNDTLVRDIAGGVPGLEPDELLAARWEKTIDPELERFAAAAKVAGVNGTPCIPGRPDGRTARAGRGRFAWARGNRPRDRSGARPVTERSVRIASAVLASLGAAISAYILYVRETDGSLVCSTGGCETVQSSSYAELLGVPIAALGLAGFLVLLVAALSRGDFARLVNATVALAAFLFAAYLLAVQLVVLDAICQWCVATDVLTTAIAALALVRLGPANSG